ncbi:unnamed protein product [Polarella glacialis]|uniref:RING-type domain-containing protein n=1 Tax=Polarella glacialis TaxID=89957 RepID=A0A813FP03_POLGL|nr:unnamed protein product [Polarella glacialis]
MDVREAEAEELDDLRDCLHMGASDDSPMASTKAPASSFGEDVRTQSWTQSSMDTVVDEVGSIVDTVVDSDCEQEYVGAMGVPLLGFNMDSLLRSVLNESEETLPGTVRSQVPDELAAAEGPLRQANLQPVRLPRLPGVANRGEFSLDWMWQLSMRSSTVCVLETARSLGEESVYTPTQMAGIPAASFADSGTFRLGSPSLLSEDAAEDSTSEDVVSVPLLDRNDSRRSWDEQAVEMGGHTSYLMDSDALSASPASVDSFTSPRPMFDDSVGEMLRRISFENNLLDDAVYGTLQRVLQMDSAQDPPGLSEEKIRDLPKVRYTGKDHNCSICLDSFQEGDLLTALPCEHFFHSECVTHWMQRATRCPLCRTSVE